MRTERESVLRELIEGRNRKLATEMTKLPVGTSEPPEEMLTAMFELDELQDELEALREDGSDFGNAPVCVPLKPPPNLNSGAIVLPVPDEERNTRARGKSQNG
jgi:hypothetical protein